MPQAKRRSPRQQNLQGEANWRSRCHFGAVWLFILARYLIRLSGWRIVYLAAFIGAWFYFVFGEKSRRESIRYWRHLRPDSAYNDQWRWYYQHLVRWGRNLMDRSLFYLKDYSYSGEGLEGLRQALEKGQGCILLSAHVGNWEISAARLNSLTKGKTSIVRIIDDSPKLRQVVEKSMGDRPPEHIDPRNFMAASFQIRSALENGHLVCMLGDRQLTGQAAIRVPFLGEPANFSSGPFLVAGLTDTPVFIGFFMKRGRRHYHVEVDAPFYVSLPPKGKDREEVLEQAVRHWSRRLEQTVHKHPIQWHNFMNFWAQ